MIATSDLRDRLIDDHRQLSAVLEGVAGAPEPSATAAAMGSTTLDLAAHLAATDVLVHPLARHVLADGHTTVAHRRLEARTVLHHLRVAGRWLDDTVRFRDAARRAANSFATYREREELEVLPFVQHAVVPEEFDRLGDLLPRVHRRALTGYGQASAAPRPWDDPSLLPRLVREAGDALEELGPPQLSGEPRRRPHRGSRPRPRGRQGSIALPGPRLIP